MAEGYLDVIALARAGLEHGVAPLGTAVTDISKQKEAEDVLRRSHDELEKRVADRTRELRSEIRVREIAESRA